MSTPPKDMFDAKVFLAKVGDGKAILEFHKNQKIFEQGDVAETIFYIQKGKVKLTVLSEQGKEAGFDALMPKPFSMPSITQKIEELLGFKQKVSLVDMVKRQTSKLNVLAF